MTPIQITEKYGYTLDSHWVTTDDGYIMEVHNIPKRGSPVVFLQHGLLDSSMTWMLNRKEGSFAFILSDSGFEVWMGNFRGNTYSKNHTTLAVLSKNHFAVCTWNCYSSAQQCRPKFSR